MDVATFPGDTILRHGSVKTQLCYPTEFCWVAGAGPIRVKDRQGLTWPDEHTIKIESVPELQISYAKALKTMATLLISETSQGVSIDVAVKVRWHHAGAISGSSSAMLCTRMVACLACQCNCRVWCVLCAWILRP